MIRKIIFWVTILVSFMGFSFKIKGSSFSFDTYPYLFLDSIFSPAINSPGYMVVKKKDLDLWVQQLNDSLDYQRSRYESSQILFQNKIDSILNNSSNAILKEPNKDSLEKGNLWINLFFDMRSVFLILVVVYGLGLTLKFFHQIKILTMQKESLKQVESDFSDHKKSSVERERKLMRELIDTKNLLELERSAKNEN